MATRLVGLFRFFMLQFKNYGTDWSDPEQRERRQEASLV
jgi:hypothetical protein